MAYEHNNITENNGGTKPHGFTSKKNLIFIILVAVLTFAIGGAVLVAGVSNTPENRLSRHMRAAERYLAEMDYERAVIEYQRALEIEPMNVDAILGLADAYIGLGDTDKAIEVLRDGLERTGDERIRAKLEELEKQEVPPVPSESEEVPSEPEEGEEPPIPSESEKPAEKPDPEPGKTTLNENEVKILNTIIKEQNSRGATLPTDLNDMRYDWDENGSLIGLDLSNCGLKDSLSLKGFVSLTYLKCYDNKLSSLDVNNNKELTHLWCGDNELSSLDVSNNKKLILLWCGGNDLYDLDVSNNKKLAYLWCYKNQLSSLDVHNNMLLEELHCDQNQITNLNVEKHKLLLILDCSKNQLSNLDVSNNTQLTDLNCSSNKLNSLNVSNNTQLTYLWCHENQLINLDVSKNTQLILLWCYSNQLNNLDVSNCTALTPENLIYNETVIVSWDN